MAAMPEHDPVPLPPSDAGPSREADFQRAAEAWARYKRMMKWMVLAAVLTVLAALAWLARNGEPMPVHLIVATAAGVGLSVLVGTGLMGLVFLSNRGGHDDAASGPGDRR